jgi:hypothetical protein
VLKAYDAANLSRTLYASNQNSLRDNPGVAVKFARPTVVNGKVYVGTTGQLSVFGLLGESSLSIRSRPALGTFMLILNPLRAAR